MTTLRELSRCPHCGAVGVKIYDPITIDTQPVDAPYCGQCGKNWPEPKTPKPTAPNTEYSR
jgi:hypothetical protein